MNAESPWSRQPMSSSHLRSSAALQQQEVTTPENVVQPAAQQPRSGLRTHRRSRGARCLHDRSRCRWKTATPWPRRDAWIWPRSSAWSAATVPPWPWPSSPWCPCWRASSSTGPWGGSGGRPRPPKATGRAAERRGAHRRASRARRSRTAPRTQQVRKYPLDNVTRRWITAVYRCRDSQVYSGILACRLWWKHDSPVRNSYSAIMTPYI